MGDAPHGGELDLVPARMVNEFSYCPRLFYLEWVNAQFVDSDETVDGRYRHRVVDREQGAAPLPDDGDLKAARSLMLSSSDLGLVARIDLVEGDRDEVHPVDVKRGKPAPLPERAWEPERVQLCVAGLLLRDAGYICNSGYLSFAATRERVEVVFDDTLIARTREIVEELRVVAMASSAPPPLIASRKCPRCSMVGICLPDETNSLSARSGLPVRRLLPSDPAAAPLYVTEQGSRVGYRSGRITVEHDGAELASVRAIDVSQLSLYGNAQVSSQAIREMMARDIPVCWFSYGGWFAGIAEGLPSKNVELRIRQVSRAHVGSPEIAAEIVRGKIHNSRTLLRRNARSDVASALESLASIEASVAPEAELSSLLGLEGAAARIYFESFPTMIRADLGLPGGPFRFESRNRRPPLDAVNCLLSYVYSLLVKELTVTTLVVGFDPYLGFYHRPRFGRPALALDLAEEFRPLIGESVVVNLINNQEIHGSQFTVRAGGVSLTAEGRKAVLAAYERRLRAEIRHPIFGYTVSYRRLLEVQTRLLGATLLGEVPSYRAFTTR
jgi:CRISPR-associated protein Cas1